MPSRALVKHTHLKKRTSLPALKPDITGTCHAIFEQAKGGVWIVSLDGITTYANASLVKLLGYTKGEMIGRSLYNFMDDQGKKIAQKNLEQRKKGLSADHTFCLKHKNGGNVWILAAANPIRNPSGTIVGAMAFITEIDESSVNLKSPKECGLLECENLTLNSQAFEVQIEGKSIELTAFSFKILQYFLKNTNRLIPREEFLKEIWGDSSLDARVIDVHIVSLRKKLKPFRGEIKTIYGVGYIMRAAH